jgi:hypothetical protein
MVPFVPRCSSCRNFLGCQAQAGLCRVWQVILPAGSASARTCPHWQGASRR